MKKSKKISVKKVAVHAPKLGPIERNMMNDAEANGSYGINTFKPNQNIEWPQQ